jgi:hypothetical protein
MNKFYKLLLTNNNLKMQIKDFPYEFERIDTIGDGSCFLHAILGCCSKKYITSSEREKKIIIRGLRNDLAKVLDVKVKDKTIYQTLSRGEIEDISKYVKEMKKDYMQNHLKSGRWLNATFLELISNMLNINIVVVSFQLKEIYKTGDKELLFQDRHNIFINYLDQAHFESLGIRTEEGLKTFFHKDSEISQRIKNLV